MASPFLSCWWAIPLYSLMVSTLQTIVFLGLIKAVFNFLNPGFQDKTMIWIVVGGTTVINLTFCSFGPQTALKASTGAMLFYLATVIIGSVLIRVLEMIIVWSIRKRPCRLWNC